MVVVIATNIVQRASSSVPVQSGNLGIFAPEVVGSGSVLNGGNGNPDAAVCGNPVLSMPSNVSKKVRITTSVAPHPMDQSPLFSAMVALNPIRGGMTLARRSRERIRFLLPGLTQ